MTTAVRGTTGRWLYGPASDLLFGCGVWYLLALVAFVIADPAIRTGGGADILPFLVLVFSTPHYGATLLRVYERREDRRAYTYFAVHASLVIAAIFAVGVHHGFVGSLILTVYFTWSPWHYTGQNYGIAVMFLRRRGIDLVRANAIKMVVITALTVVAVPVFVIENRIAWLPAAVLAGGYAIGGTLGTRLAVRRGEQLIRPVLAIAVVAMAGRLLGLY